MKINEWALPAHLRLVLLGLSSSVYGWQTPGQPVPFRRCGAPWGSADMSFSTGMPIVSGQPCAAIPEALANRSGPESAVFDEGSGSPA